jgi:hypothetical protein
MNGAQIENIYEMALQPVMAGSQTSAKNLIRNE